MSFTSIPGFQINNQIVKPSVRGSIFYVGGIGPGNYSSIKEAIKNATDGDTIFVFSDSSPYYENVALGKSINLIGEDKNTTTIVGTISFGAYYATISRFTIRNRDGVYAHSGYANIIDNNIIYNSRGIDLGNSGDNRIIGNNISNNRGCGIEAWFYWGGNKIIGNIIKSNEGTGIWFAPTGGWNIIKDNVIADHGCGISLMDGGNNSITGNVIISNTGIGIDLFCGGNTVTRNSFQNNDIGLMEIGSNVIEYNNFIGNDVHTTFHYRGIRAIFSTSRNLNYWDRPRLLPYPIFGRVGFFGLIPWIEFDWNPAKEPYDITTTIQGCGI